MQQFVTSAGHLSVASTWKSLTEAPLLLLSPKTLLQLFRTSPKPPPPRLPPPHLSHVASMKGEQDNGTTNVPPASHGRLFLGTAGYSYPHWRKSFYPHGKSFLCAEPYGEGAHVHTLEPLPAPSFTCPVIHPIICDCMETTSHHSPFFPQQNK